MDRQANTRSLYDLHLHTWWSYDATAHPEYYLKRASEWGMRCLAITEHHGLDSQEELLEILPDYPDVRVIPAAELTVSTSIGAVDLLCFGFATVWPESLKQVLRRYHKWQCDYGAGICEGMQALGFDFSEQDHLRLLESYRPAHVLDVMGPTRVRNQVLRDHFISRGFIGGPEEYVPLIERIGRQGYLPAYPPVQEVVPAVHAAGALIAIAHPYGDFEGTNRKRMDALREECQLDGIECAHTSTPAEVTPVYRQYCLEHGLFSTAGSDCHTNDDIDQKLGMHGGAEEWLDELLERLDGPAARRQQA